MVDIHGPLQTRGESRCPGGVRVSCLARQMKGSGLERIAMCKLWPWRYVPESRSWYDCMIYYQDPTWITYCPDTVLGICALWPWPRRYDLGLRPWHILRSWTTIIWNIIHIQLGNEELWPKHGFWVCMPWDPDLGDMSLGQGYDTSFGHRQ